MSINNTTPHDWYQASYNVAKDTWEEKNRNGNKALGIQIGGQAGAIRAVDTQVGGTHYKKFKIQPAEFCYKNEIPYLEATAIKYLCRWKDKGGIQDLEKAKHFIDLLIEFENANH